MLDFSPAVAVPWRLSLHHLPGLCTGCLEATGARSYGLLPGVLKLGVIPRPGTVRVCIPELPRMLLLLGTPRGQSAVYGCVSSPSAVRTVWRRCGQCSPVHRSSVLGACCGAQQNTGSALPGGYGPAPSQSITARCAHRGTGPAGLRHVEERVLQGHAGWGQPSPGPASQAPCGHSSVDEGGPLHVWAPPPVLVSCRSSAPRRPHPPGCGGPLFKCQWEHSLLASGTLEGPTDSSACGGQSSGWGPRSIHPRPTCQLSPH